VQQGCARIASKGILIGDYIDRLAVSSLTLLFLNSLSLTLSLFFSLFLTLYFSLYFFCCSIACTTTAISLLTTRPPTCLSLYLSSSYLLNSLSLSLLLLLLLLPPLSIYSACSSTVSLYALFSSSYIFALLAFCSPYTIPITTCLYIQRLCSACSVCSLSTFLSLSRLHRSSATLYF
jgi:hypothetical protein